jgi:hypothetical protein
MGIHSSELSTQCEVVLSPQILYLEVDYLIHLPHVMCLSSTTSANLSINVPFNMYAIH